MHQRILWRVQWVALISATWLRSFKFRSSRPEINDRSCRELQVQVAQVSQGLAEGVRVDSTTMFWTARRYLTARDEELRSRYGRLPAGGREADGYHYTGEAKRIFPRYNLVEAVLIEVERLDQDQLPDVDTVAETLFAAAEGAQSAFTTPPHDVIEAQAIDEERRLFALNVQRWKGDPDLQADPMPYRRVLAPDESSLWRAELRRRWRVRNGDWHPLLSNSIPPDVLVLTGESMWADDGVTQVRQVLRDLGRVRIVELREYGADYLLDVEIFAPRYTGAEGLWSDSHHDWIAYASHEGTVAFGGVLADTLVTTWPEISDWQWPGWPEPTRR